MAIVYQTQLMGEANFRVAVVSERSMADLLVYRVSSRGMARGDALWYITADKNDATTALWFCSVGMAQFKVCFVDSMGQAGWVTETRYKGRLGR